MWNTKENVDIDDLLGSKINLIRKFYNKAKC